MARASTKAAAPAPAPTPAAAAPKTTRKAPSAAPAPAPEPTPEPEVVEETVTETVAEAEVVIPEQSLFDVLVAAAMTANAGFVTPHAKESEQAFYKRLMGDLGKIEDAVYNALPESAQLWYNAAIDAMEAGKAIAALPGFDSVMNTTATDAPAAKRKGNTDALKAHQAKVKAAKEAAIARGEAPPAKAPKVKAEKGPRAKKEGSSTSAIRRLVIGNPALTVEQIAAELVKLGIPTANGTILVTRGGTLDALNILKELGKLK